MAQADLIIRTKLRLPFIRPEQVLRPRLLEQIQEGLNAPLTLVIAPAGFGKTTLVASWVTACELPVAWFSIDQEDNQPRRFLSYLVAAFGTVDSALGKQAANQLSGSQQIPSQDILTSLINDLETSPQEILLVLDDYQFIRNLDVHADMVFLLEHCPHNLHILIASRSDPPLLLSRFRARGQMVEVRAADLRFTPSESAQFLNDLMGLNLDGDSIAVLSDRTEGWAAGLQMAALSLRHHPDIPGFIAGFSGTNRYILDYLIEEVLASQPPEIKRFLLYTAILERLTAPLCDTLLSDPISNGSQAEFPGTGLAPLPDSQSLPILAYLEQSNLFLVPLDDERTWYRYHQLFADLLRAQLHQSLGTSAVAALHLRAADWHAKHDSILQAIHHASQAGDHTRVEGFIERHYREMVRLGEMAGMRYWTNQLSREVVYRRPWLCIYAAYSHSWFGELDEADRLLEQAGNLIHLGVPAQDLPNMLGLHAYVKSRVTAMRGDLPGAIQYCLEAGQHAPVANLALQLDTRITLGYEYFLSGDYTNASQVLESMVRAGISAGAVINTVAASCLLARMHANQGLLHQSFERYQRAAQSIPGASDQHLGVRALVDVGLAELYYQRNDLEAAWVHLQRGLVDLPLWDKADDLALAHITLMCLHLANANDLEARAALEKAARFTQTRGVFPEAKTAVEAARVKLWLAEGDLDAANRWAANRWAANRWAASPESPDYQAGFDAYVREPACISLARVWLAQGKTTTALRFLSQLEEHAESAGRMGRLLEIRLLQALAQLETGEIENTFQTLEKCLAWAQAEGYVRVFLEGYQPMQRLLDEWLARARPSPLRDYASRLRSQFDSGLRGETATSGTITKRGESRVAPIQALIEPLSPRELEVLQLIALGHPNREIARQLVIAPGTVKAHTSNIYRKLEVANRTEAVNRARQLGLLP